MIQLEFHNKYNTIQKFKINVSGSSTLPEVRLNIPLTDEVNSIALSVIGNIKKIEEQYIAEFNVPPLQNYTSKSSISNISMEVFIDGMFKVPLKAQANILNDSSNKKSIDINVIKDDIKQNTIQENTDIIDSNINSRKTKLNNIIEENKYKRQDIIEEQTIIPDTNIHKDIIEEQTIIPDTNIHKDIIEEQTIIPDNNDDDIMIKNLVKEYFSNGNIEGYL